MCCLPVARPGEAKMTHRGSYPQWYAVCGGSNWNEVVLFTVVKCCEGRCTGRSFKAEETEYANINIVLGALISC